MVPELLIDPDLVVSDLELVLPEIIRGLEHGLQEARAYFDAKPVRFDASAFSILTRLHARDYLRKKSLDTTAIEIERVNLCGLWLKLGKYQVKVWKIGSDDLKKGLQSEAYGRSQMELELDGAPLSGYGLAVYWLADPLHHLSSVHLVHQIHDDPRCFEWIWNRPIPQVPAEQIVQPTNAGDVPVETIVTKKDQRAG